MVLLLVSTLQFIITHLVLVSYVAIHHNSDPTSGPISGTQCQIAILNVESMQTRIESISDSEVDRRKHANAH